MLIIDVDDNSFHTNREDLGKIITAIDAEIHGLFPNEAQMKASPVKKLAKPDAKLAVKKKEAVKKK